MGVSHPAQRKAVIFLSIQPADYFDISLEGWAEYLFLPDQEDFLMPTGI
jgi:hypothetical protein